MTTSINKLNLTFTPMESELIYRLTMSYTEGFCPQDEEDALWASTEWVLKLLRKHGLKNDTYKEAVPELIEKLKVGLAAFK